MKLAKALEIDEIAFIDFINEFKAAKQNNGFCPLNR